jgi:TRAP-type C4-dicarboxylate transport system permease large subunit
MEQISRAVMPFLLVMLVDLLVITFVPFFTNLLPALFMGQ